MNVGFVRTYGAAPLPKRATEGSIGYDLSTVEDVTIPAGQVKIAKTGFKLAADLPRYQPGTGLSPRLANELSGDGSAVALLVLPRSSLSLKYGLMIPNSPGLIDTDYSEEIGVLLYNFRDNYVTLPTGTRIAQLVFVSALQPIIEEAEKREGSTRGGFGSTGV